MEKFCGRSPFLGVGTNFYGTVWFSERRITLSSDAHTRRVLPHNLLWQRLQIVSVQTNIDGNAYDFKALSYVCGDAYRLRVSTQRMQGNAHNLSPSNAKLHPTLAKRERYRRVYATVTIAERSHIFFTDA